MDKKLILTSSIKLAGALIVIILFFVYIHQYAPFSTVSPDSVRFMHIWQINLDKFNGGDHNPEGALKTIYHALSLSTNYDVNRGRYVQYILYGLDSVTRWILPYVGNNFLMILFLIINAGLISWVATVSIGHLPARINLFCLSWAFLTTSSFVISPAILIILYGKYVWVTFVLAFFIARRKIFKISWLAAAAFSDEFGLFAVMLVIFLSVIRFCLDNNYGYYAPGNSSVLRIMRIFFWGALTSLASLFVFYGISAVLFNVGASGFQAFAFGISSNAVHGVGLWNIVSGVLWRAEVLLLGLSFGNIVATIIVGSVVLLIIMAGAWKRRKVITNLQLNESRKLEDWLHKCLRDELSFLYTFWFIMLFLIAVIILPGKSGDLTHYSYPAVAILSVLFITTLIEVFSNNKVYLFLSICLLVHLVLLPRAVETTSKILEAYLFPDSTVTVQDINAINKCVKELKKTGKSQLFNSFNNGQEIDYSGTWFYSRIKGYGTAVGPYFPIEGTVRVLAWPNKINNIKSKRLFDTKSPTFKDNRFY